MERTVELQVFAPAGNVAEKKAHRNRCIYVYLVLTQGV